ncbi:hypothetical protein [Jiangella rhizosphaerae]|uniref:hypothetical protein n=1 Tax=Jiangella rhizosphaerae TaxID=2293569 RepID=UPI0011C3E585|nr:hypothetical protein [Jiangella rhizosphaerae]
MDAQTKRQDSAAIDELQAAMRLEAPEGWTRTVLEVSAAADRVAFVQRFMLAEGASSIRIELDDRERDVRLRRAIHDLRAAMHRPGTGTWYSAVFTLTAEGELTSEFDYDNPPFDGVVDEYDLNADHEMFPRDADHLPAWHLASNQRRWRGWRLPEPPPDPDQPTTHQLSRIADVMTKPAEDLDWTRLVLAVTGAGDALAMRLTVEHADGTWSRQWTPIRVESGDADTVRKVRQDMARYGKGTWYNATFTLDSETQNPRAELDYDNPPFDSTWDSTGGVWPVDELLLDDHKQFPRDDERLPAWHPARGEQRQPMPQPDLSSQPEEPLDHSPYNWIKQFMLRLATKSDSSNQLHIRSPWSKVTMVASAAGRNVEMKATVLRPDGTVDSPRVVEYHRGLAERLVEVRRNTARPGRGAWYNATFVIDHSDGELQAEYDYDNPPINVEYPSVLNTHLRDDQQMFPRDREHLPEWHPENIDPPPVLQFDGPRPETDDPLLRLGYAVVDRMPVDDHWWSRITLQITAAADTVRTCVVATFQEDDAPYERYLYLPGLEEACLELRRSMYDPSTGAWYRAIITIERPRLHIKHWYDYEAPPFAGFWGPREWESIQRDHELYPRDPDELPDWHPASAAPE